MLEEYGDLLTVKDCMEILKISKKTALKLIHDEIPHIYIGRHIRVAKDELAQYLDYNTLR